MASLCSSCGRLPPEDARFCPYCGSPLAVSSAQERKYATALFADLVGSTALGERADPELVQELATRVFDRMRPIVDRYGGVIDNYLGDGILAVFGVPVVHEDDPERAVRAALEMQATLAEVNGAFHAEGRPELMMRIGLEAGDVLVDPDRPDRRISGDVVNLAARLQTVAEPGTVVSGPAVHTATHQLIDFQALPALELKGKKHLVPAWRALRVARRVRGERPGLGLRARLVGRDEELALLRQAYRRVEREGQPTLVTIMGPAGSGKSRLVRELRDWLDGLSTDVYWREGRSLAYGNVSYSALAEAMKAHCEVLEDDAPEVVTAKVERAVADLFVEGGPVNELLALVGAAPPDTVEKERLFESWRRMLEHMAARYPLVLVLEDLHWADAGLLEFVEHVVDWATGAILVVTLARPELFDRNPRWGGGKRNYSAVYLEPLTPEENHLMLLDLIGAELPAQLSDAVVERAEGNPLFTEELVRILMDRGLVGAESGRWNVAAGAEAFEVPRSMSALIAARLDLLSPEEKATLQNAAVVGRTAWSGAVAALSEGDLEAIRSLLASLRMKDLIVPSEPPAFSGEQEFWFRHVLIRDVAYESIPKRARAVKHRLVAEWAEERVGARIDDLAELIASHYRQAWDYLKTLEVPHSDRMPVAEKLLRWSEAAGERAERLWQKAEAATWYRQAIEAAEVTTASQPVLARLSESFGRAGVGGAPYPEVVSALQHALDLYESTGRSLDAGRVETALGVAVWEGGEDAAGLPWLDKAVGRLRPLGPTLELAEALTLRGNYLRRHGELSEAGQALEEAIEVAKAVGSLQAEAWALYYLSAVYSQGRDPHRGLAAMEEALRRARELDMVDLSVRAAVGLGSHFVHDQPDHLRAEELLGSARVQARRSGLGADSLWASGNLQTLFWLSGRLREALEMNLAGLEDARGLSYPLFVRWFLSSVGYARLLQGDVEEARLLMDESGTAVEDEEAQSVAYAAIYLADLAEAEGRPDDALQMGLQSLQYFDSSFLADLEESLYFDIIRRLVTARRLDEVGPVRERLAAVAQVRPHARTFLSWADALLATDLQSRISLLEQVTATWEQIGRPLDHGRALLDLAKVIGETGANSRPILEEALGLFESSGAELYARDARRRLAELP